MENKCVYKAWEAPKSNTVSGTQKVIYNDLDVKYRFESCPDYSSCLMSNSTVTNIGEIWLLVNVKSYRAE